MDASKLEETTAEILGQIQASVAEYVRTMNEAGALRRREADEAHRQQDHALAAIKAVEAQGIAILNRHTQLVDTIGEEWMNLINRGAKDVAIAQARECAAAAVTTIDDRARKHADLMRDVIASTEDVVQRAAAISHSLAWKTIAVAAGWGVALTFLLVAIVWWRGNTAIRDRIADYAALEVAAAAVRRDVSYAEVAGCEVAGRKRLCIRIGEVLPQAGESPQTVTYATIHGY